MLTNVESPAILMQEHKGALSAHISTLTDNPISHLTAKKLTFQEEKQ